MKKRNWTALFGVAVVFAFSFAAHAASVSYTAAPLGGGLFLYDFAISNVGGPVPLAGLIIEGGNTQFGLDLTSTISAPPNWDFLAPLPPFDDELSYFSLTSASDISNGGSLDGFSFESMTDPSSVSSVSVVLVGDGSEQYPITISPEPSTFLLAGLGAVLGLLNCTRLRGRLRHWRPV